MRVKRDRCALVVGLLTLLLGPGAGAVSWSPEERANAVTRERDFLVVKEDGECVTKQSYHDNPGRMELIIKADGTAILVTPYLSTPQKVVYEVDPPGEIPANEMPISSMVSSKHMRLPSDVIDDMRRGRRLKVRARINGRWSRPHSLSLMGFSAALDVLEGPQCQ